ncbi:CsbD family protein [Paraburkholderia sp. JHI2823]|uniref:CsbD family protein n=1 Tax=Paraburkholderia TaxID=1822464 RepID=UPI00041F1D52|nr:CsbD family protein [Paraburkholderia mimosarum]
MESKATSMAREVAGEAKDLAGDVLDDPEMRLYGKAKALCGKSQRLAANAADAARDTVSENPLSMLGVAAGIGVLVGAWWAASRK